MEVQSEKYGAGKPANLAAYCRPLPFLYRSTGVETRFTNGLDPHPRSRGVFNFHRPETLVLMGWGPPPHPVATGGRCYNRAMDPETRAGRMQDWSVSAATGFVIAKPVRSALLESLSKAGKGLSEAKVVAEAEAILAGSKWVSSPRGALSDELGRLVEAGLVQQCEGRGAAKYQLTEKGRKVAARAFAPVNR